MQLVDETREDDLFISRLQEEMLQSDEKWENQVSRIADDVVASKHQLTEEAGQNQVDDLKGILNLKRD